MNHEHFREQMALRMYGELDAHDSVELERHLAQCAECRQFDAELAAGLGRVRSLGRARIADELPTDWRERLAAATRESGVRPARITPWLAAVTSFAAGILVAALMQRADAPAPNRGPLSLSDANYARYLRATPPPPSTGGGQLARLSTYVKR